MQGNRFRPHVDRQCAKGGNTTNFYQPSRKRARLKRDDRLQVLVIGGGGRVGSAATIHMLSDAGWQSPLHVTIAGRRPESAMQDVYDEIVEV